MLIGELLGAVVDHWFLAPVLLLSLHFLYNRYGRGISRFPGPFLSSVTDLWQVYLAADYNRHFLVDLHAKYGDIVRVAPGKISFANPAAIKDMLGPGTDFRKVKSTCATRFFAYARSHSTDFIDRAAFIGFQRQLRTAM